LDILGTFDYAMDERGRVPLPPRYRDAFREGIVLSQGSPDACVRVSTLSAYREQALDHRATPATQRRGLVTRRGLFPQSWTAELDKQNRVLIPQALRDYAGLSTKVLVLGMYDWLEVWDPEAYAEEAVRVAEELPAALESIGPRG
jgi:MraZ protein